MAGRSATQTLQSVLLMVRALVKDRFHLTVHLESRELPVFTLVAARKDGKPSPQARVRCASW